MVRALGRALLLTAILAAGCARAVDGGGYPPPDRGGFRYDHEWDADGDSDGVKETHFVLLRNDRGDTLFSASSHDRLWAWSLDTHGDDDADLSGNYVIVDSDCDGHFDTRYSLADEFRVPRCVKK